MRLKIYTVISCTNTDNTVFFTLANENRELYIMDIEQDGTYLFAKSGHHAFVHNFDHAWEGVNDDGMKYIAFVAHVDGKKPMKISYYYYPEDCKLFYVYTRLDEEIVMDDPSGQAQAYGL